MFMVFIGLSSGESWGKSGHFKGCCVIEGATKESLLYKYLFLSLLLGVEPRLYSVL